MYGALNTPTKLQSYPHDMNTETDSVSEIFDLWATASKIGVKDIFYRHINFDAEFQILIFSEVILVNTL